MSSVPIIPNFSTVTPSCNSDLSHTMHHSSKAFYMNYRDPTNATTAVITTRDIRSGLTSLTGATEDPVLLQKAAQKRANIIDLMKDTNVRYPSLFEDQCLAAGLVGAAMDLYATFDDEEMRSNGRWRSVSESSQDEDAVQLAFISIAEELMKRWKEELKIPERSLMDTHHKKIPDNRGTHPALRPDLFFKGCGRLFPVMSILHPPTWPSCSGPGDAKTRKGNPKADDFAQLGTYAEQVLSSQENRRFVPTFYFNEDYFRFYTFDRGGVVHGHEVNYHADPWKLCALVRYFAFEGVDIGLDPSIYFENGCTFICTTPKPNLEETGNFIPDVTFLVHQTLFHSTDIRGSGTIYWLAQGQGDAWDNWYLIKDAWIVGGCLDERQTYEQIGPLKGIAPMEFTHDVFFNGRLDSVANNRLKGVKTPPGENRTHTRAVFRVFASAKLLVQFLNIKELLEAIRDAVEGHRNLYKAGILHRNITPSCILIQADAPEAERGVLLDLHSATKAANPTPRTTEVLGTRAFYSRNALAEVDQKRRRTGSSRPHSYFDDLESFFYVLCYVVACSSACGSHRMLKAPPGISSWFAKTGGRTHKVSAFTEPEYPFPIDPSFNVPAVNDLLERLHGFFRDQHYASGPTNRIPKPEEGYRNFLNPFYQAIAALTEEDQVSNAPVSQGETNPVNLPDSYTTSNLSNGPDSSVSASHLTVTKTSTAGNTVESTLRGSSLCGSSNMVANEDTDINVLHNNHLEIGPSPDARPPYSTECARFARMDPSVTRPGGKVLSIDTVVISAQAEDVAGGMRGCRNKRQEIGHSSPASPSSSPRPSKRKRLDILGTESQYPVM